MFATIGAAAMLAAAIAPASSVAPGPLRVGLRATRGLEVELVLENLSDKPLTVPTAASFLLGRGSYWAPVYLTAGAEATGAFRVFAAKLEPPDPKRGPVRLEVRESKRVVVQLTRLRWGRAIPSPWPHERLGVAVPSGRYRLVMELSFEDADTPIRSNEVSVDVARQ